MKNVSVAFTLLLLLAFACTDHVGPGPELSIKTLPFERSNLATIFKIQVDDLGNQPVKEYGIVYTAYFRGTGDHILDPTVENNKIIFDTAMVAGINPFTYNPDFINGRTFFYYRAYAVLEDGSVVYANRISFTV